MHWVSSVADFRVGCGNLDVGAMREKGNQGRGCRGRVKYERVGLSVVDKLSWLSGNLVNDGIERSGLRDDLTNAGSVCGKLPEKSVSTFIEGFCIVFDLRGVTLYSPNTESAGGEDGHRSWGPVDRIASHRASRRRTGRTVW